MGTTWAVNVCAPPDRSLAALQADIEAALADIVHQMSPWDDLSCLSLFNGAPPSTWHEMPPDFATVLEHALTVAEQSDGAFDPTVGRFVKQWGFGPGLAGSEADFREARAERKDNRGWRAIRFGGARRRAFQPGGIHLDLCAIAKGFAVDRLAETVERHGSQSYLIEIGGELRGAGVKPDGMPWWVALEAPPSAGALPVTPAIVALCDLAVATSGGYHRYRRTEMRFVSHLVDPRSGRPLGDISSAVSVVAPLCVLADAWATALAVLGPETGPRVAAAHDIAAIFTCGNGSGQQHRMMSPAMAAMLT